MILGIDDKSALDKTLKGKKLALLSSSASLDSNLISTPSRLKEEYNLLMLLAPEHGIRGAMAAGEEIKDQRDKETGLPVFSLYGKDGGTLPEEELDKVDAIVYDVQDVGMRCYTYISSLLSLMKYAANRGKEIIVLDRPNPLSDVVDGPVLDMKYSSFVSAYPFTLRYGLTIGEASTMMKDEENMSLDLSVVEMKDYNREQYYDEYNRPWIAPSPALSHIENVLLYSGFCLIEGTNLSEGRGTTSPFSFIGAPFIDGWKLSRHLNSLSIPGMVFAPADFVPSFSKHSGTLCSGVEAFVTDRKRYSGTRSVISFLLGVYNLYGDNLEFLSRSDLLGARMNNLLGLEFKGIETLRELKRDDYYLIRKDEEVFKNRRKQYRRY